METFQLLEHPSDIGLEARASSLEGLFTIAARGMFSIMLGEYEIEKINDIRIKLVARDAEQLLVRWLSELLFYFETKKYIFTNADFAVCSQTALDAVVSVAELRNIPNEVCVQIKAVTYHQLFVQKSEDGIWRTKIFFDV